MSATKRLLVHTANTLVPVSVIITSVGRQNREKMKILDGDNRTLTSVEGVRAKRDIVQFVGEFLIPFYCHLQTWRKLRKPSLPPQSSLLGTESLTEQLQLSAFKFPYKLTKVGAKTSFFHFLGLKSD